MASYKYRILNVFAREGRLTGNPLAVFENGEGLSDELMQALARQFNLSETTFVLPSVAVEVPAGQSLFLLATPISDTFVGMGSRPPGVITLEDTVVKLPVVRP
jgi:hypothetical protein